MAALTIRNLEDSLKQLLRIRAAQHGVSMEEEARRILREALGRGSPEQPLGQRLRQRFEALADADFTLPPRRPTRRPPDLGDGA